MDRENIVLFYGCDTQVGTTMTALSAAELLAEEGKKVIYISAGPVPGNPFLENEPAGAAVDLWGGLPEEKEILQLLTEQRGVDILQGTRSWMNSGSSMNGLLEEICRECSLSWDYVIVDGGSSGEASMGREALSFAGKIFLVLTQQEKSLQRWRMRREWLESRMNIKPCYLVNKFIGNGTFYSERQLLKILQCGEEKLAAVPYLPYGWQAEYEHCTLLKHRIYRKYLKLITEMIQEETDCDTSER